MKEVVKAFEKVDYDVEYNNELQVNIYLAPPLSIKDIEFLEKLTKKYSFTYSAISSKDINRQNRNSKIEITLEERRNNEREI